MKALSKKDQTTMIFFIGERSLRLRTAIEKQDWDEVRKVQEDLQERFNSLKERTGCFKF